MFFNETSRGTVSSCLLSRQFLLLLSLITFPPHSLSYSSGGDAAYVRAEAASAKLLSNALGRHFAHGGSSAGEAFFFNLLNVRLLDFGIMPKMPRKKGHEIRREKGGKTPP